jgi:FkbM family methyltransferase
MNIIQIGCHDGDDHVFNFISSNRDKISRAVLVEPLHEKIEEAKIRYKDFKFVEFLELAVVDFEGKNEVSFFFPEDLRHSQISSISLSHVEKHIGGVKEIKVKCLNIKDFLIRLNMPTIDRFYIDTEGLDCKLIKQIDFSKYDIRYLEYEYVHSDGTDCYGENGRSVELMLLLMGYQKTHNPPFNVVFNK